MQDDRVRINVLIDEDEREAFDRWCRYGGKPRVSMNAAACELFRLAAAGHIKIDRAKIHTTPGPRPKAKAGLGSRPPKK